MKLLTVFLILASIFTACKDRKIQSQYMTNVAVSRDTKETGNSSSNANNRKELQPAQVSPFSDLGMENNTPSPQGNPIYYVIVRSYPPSQYNQAKAMVRKLKERNYPALLINKDNRYRVGIESFNNKMDADKACEEYRKTTENPDIWVLKLN